MNTDPGCRRAATARLYWDWLYERPPTIARISPVLGIDGDERGLGAALALAARQQLVHAASGPSRTASWRQALQVQVERGVHVDRLFVVVVRPG